MEISQLICTANQLAGFYMRATLAFKPALIALLLRNPTNFAKVNNLMLNVMRLKTHCSLCLQPSHSRVISTNDCHLNSNTEWLFLNLNKGQCELAPRRL